MSLTNGIAGDIWSTGAFSFESPLKELLDTKEYTLEQLLAEDELLQELRGVHPELIQFFSTAEAVTKLVEYVIQPHYIQRTGEPNGEGGAGEGGNASSVIDPLKPRKPEAWMTDHKEKTAAAGGKLANPEEDPELRHIRFPYMACEIICCEITSVIDILVDGNVEKPPDSEESIVASPDADAERDKTENENQKESTGPDDKQKETPASSCEEGNVQPMRILDLLFSLLYNSEPGELDDYRAGYFDKVLTVLFRRRPQDLSKYLNEGGSKGAESLMTVMFSHLYSHSIMQITQRLMLPQRPTPPPPPQSEEGAEILAEEQGMMDDDPGVMSDWSTSEKALDILLTGLIDPVVSASLRTREEVEEHKLDLSLNASEVLITVIQNSMLSSSTMLSLTSMETVQRLVVAATTLRVAGDEEEYFSPHESLLTSAMNVLESLILQLGGYGAVGTMFVLPEDDLPRDEDLEGTSALSIDEHEGPKQFIADLGSIIAHLPQLLDAMASLLRHPSTQTWKSPMQFAAAEPQQLLGSSRLRVVRVLESLVLLGDPDVDDKLVESSCLEICLELFWEFQWCSMLHQSVANLLVHVFEGQNTRISMQEYFLLKCNLLGRLMNSFDGRIPEDGEKSDATRIGGGAALSSCSDAVEQNCAETGEAVDTSAESNLESTEHSGETETRAAGLSPSQSFRFGYMGHVIIICQALVHACSNEMEQEEQMQLDGEDPIEAMPPSDINPEPLLIAELVANHDLSHKWYDFIGTTLASETAIQSTPLGGYMGPGQDPMGMRPGLADDGDIMGDDGMGPPTPPRGMLDGGDVIDMDDNDLDMAASMMAGMSLPKSSDADSTDSNSLNSGDSEKSYNSGETASDKTGYAFDDPLARAGGLGIELGKLGEYGSGDSRDADAAVGAVSPDTEDDDHSSSDEEPEKEETGGDVPVMDLFAGNFEPDFANFDKAEDQFGDFVAANESQAENLTPAETTEAENAEKLFGNSSGSGLLLDQTDYPAEVSNSAEGEASSENERSAEIQTADSLTPEERVGPETNSATPMDQGVSASKDKNTES